MTYFLVFVGCCLWWHPVGFKSRAECEEAGVRVEVQLKEIFNANHYIKYLCLEK